MGRPGRKLDRLEGGVDVIDDPSYLDLHSITAGVRDGTAPEYAYTSAVPAGHRRRFAQFFTPPKVANLMTEWALGKRPASLLDPAAGMGVFIRTAQARRPDIHITAFEKDPVVLRAYLSTQPDLRSLEIIHGDFLTCDLLLSFDAVLMNPPYLRHHDMAYNFDIFSYFSRYYGVKISRLSNSYVLFTLKAVSALNVGGRASIIIPSEWMNANFGFALKDFLLSRHFLREIIYFSNCSEIFDDALTTACVLLVERPS